MSNAADAVLLQEHLKALNLNHMRRHLEEHLR